MARRRSINAPIRPTILRPDSSKLRIRIPQTPLRPLILHGPGDARKAEFIRPPEQAWFVEHRRGIHRPQVGIDPLEARAVPESQVRGWLHERIVWLYLAQQLHLVPGIDFDFQSSQQGGRIELGGLVVDFLFPLIKIVIQVQGPQHYATLGQKKDEEQAQILAEMGYTVYYLDIKVIEDEMRFEEWMKRLFGLWHGMGGSVPAVMDQTPKEELTQAQIDALFGHLVDIEDWLMVL